MNVELQRVYRGSGTKTIQSYDYRNKSNCLKTKFPHSSIDDDRRIVIHGTTVSSRNRSGTLSSNRVNDKSNTSNNNSLVNNNKQLSSNSIRRFSQTISKVMSIECLRKHLAG
ncbi:hypothetical protein ANTPLA_LOCUS7776 [Anthophora plagiata]